MTECWESELTVTPKLPSSKFVYDKSVDEDKSSFTRIDNYCFESNGTAINCNCFGINF